ncbi:ribonuclease HIII [Spiroplasma cantharicola]|uniref:Ribonuclease n=1 Tax=Spiroplasma cantharicola TaxID=362837 RepID=A0A0M5KH18_9MOLU|nr:ribonuclease HIII [Spiroplasma cantharicola]ALD66663.1 ribonuclease HIII [Spiroplasma cantharicola]
MQNLSFKKVTQKILNKIIEENKQFLIPSNNSNIKYLFKINDLLISIYNTNTLLIQGKKALEFSLKYNLKDHKINKVVNKFITLPNIGCDEVGVGDFFGPLITCCAYVERDFEIKYPTLLAEITDSKKITDINIYNLFEKIKDKVIWEIYILENKKYNQAFDIYKNTHILKAICHNQALKRLFRNNNNLKEIPIIMDQFASEKNYYNYLIDQEIIIKDIHFETKAESKYLSVACASIIARYHFLESIKDLEKEYNVKLPLGASNNVKEYVNKYKAEMKDKVTSFTKMHFNSKK